jgi:hypothetical protein
MSRTGSAEEGDVGQKVLVRFALGDQQRRPVCPAR